MFIGYASSHIYGAQTVLYRKYNILFRRERGWESIHTATIKEATLKLLILPSKNQCARPATVSEIKDLEEVFTG